jgi:hypothetical protein
MNLFFCAWLLGFWIPSFEENPTSLTHPRAWHPLSQGIARLPDGALKVWYDANSVSPNDFFWGYGHAGRHPGYEQFCAPQRVVTTNATAGASTLTLLGTTQLVYHNGPNLGMLLRLEGDPSSTTYEITGVNSNILTVTPNIQHTLTNARVLIAQVARFRDHSGNRRDMGTWPLADSFSPSVYMSDGNSGALYMDGFRYHFGNGPQMLTDVTSEGISVGARDLGVSGIGLQSAAQVGVQELIIGTAAALDENTRLQLEGYLAWKWQGQGKLAPTHPYAEAPPSWDPSALNTNLLLWIDANHAASLFSDSACTTSASSGQAIGCWQDRSSYARHLIQTESPLQPTYFDSTANAFGVPVPGVRANANQYLSSGPATWLNSTPVFVASVATKHNPEGMRFQNGPISVRSVSNGANNDWWVFPYDSSNCVGMQRQQGGVRQAYFIASPPIWEKEEIMGNVRFIPRFQGFFSLHVLFTRDAPLYLHEQPFLLAMVVKKEPSVAGMFLSVLKSDMTFGSSNSFADSLLYLHSKGSSIFEAPYNFTSQPTLYFFWKPQKNDPPIVKVNGQHLTLSKHNRHYPAVSANSYTTLSINDRWSENSAQFKGKIYEIMVLTGPLKEPHHRIIEGYLAWKWGLEKSLPRRHPYYRVPPGK